LPALTSYFFAEPGEDRSLITDNKQLKKLEPSEIDQLIAAARGKLAGVEQWDAEHIQTALNELLEQTGQKPGILFSLIRIYTTWAPFSPELPATLALLGKERTLARLG
jgi:nondiscriminating glutamyl-tRNA synthetase